MEEFMDASPHLHLTSDPARHSRLRRWAIALGYAVAAFMALAIDVPVSSSLKKGIPRFLGEFFENCETFGNGYGVTLILVAVVVLDRIRPRMIRFLVAGSLGAGLVSNLLKLTLDRTRPRDFDFSSASVWDTFQRASEEVRSSQSMPSSHTATAVGLAIVLSALYPRGRWYFAVLAALVGIQRIVTLAHYPSDVLGGAAVGSLIGMWAVASMAAETQRSLTGTNPESVASSAKV